VIVELFVPGFGFFGISGSISIVAGIIVRICQGLNLTQSLTLVLLIIGFYVFIIAIMIYGVQYGFLGKSGLFERRTTLSRDYNEPERRIRKLVGKSGKAITSLDLAGQAKIRGQIYEVISRTSYIEKGSNIKVVEIKDNNIIVRKWFE